MPWIHHTDTTEEYPVLRTVSANGVVEDILCPKCDPYDWGWSQNELDN